MMRMSMSATLPSMPWRLSRQIRQVGGCGNQTFLTLVTWTGSALTPQMTRTTRTVTTGDVVQSSLIAEVRFVEVFYSLVAAGKVVRM
mmetsp:Transcript_99037/g.178847  ORF Transcript_99037/g.178847 Transcript_99037/m.178847 type:complete len:87 (-) Transcript_99037:202-462(-)